MSAVWFQTSTADHAAQHQEALERRAAETEAKAYLEGLKSAAWWASQAWQQQAQHDWPQGWPLGWPEQAQQEQAWPQQQQPYASAPGEWSVPQPLPSPPCELPPVLESPSKVEFTTASAARAGGVPPPPDLEPLPSKLDIPDRVTPKLGAVPSSPTEMLKRDDSEDKPAGGCVLH